MSRSIIDRSNKSIAANYNVTPGMIHAIRTNRAWKYYKEEE